MIAQHSQGPLFSPQLSFSQLGWAAFALEVYDELLLFVDALFAISHKLERQRYPTVAIFACSPHSASFRSKFGLADGPHWNYGIKGLCSCEAPAVSCPNLLMFWLCAHSEPIFVSVST